MRAAAVPALVRWFLVATLCHGRASGVINVVAIAEPNGLARTPPMGWMSWQTFRCTNNCTLAPDDCISETLYRGQADALVDGGYAQAGYASIHLDDCIIAPTRDSAGKLQADPARFPSGFAALGAYIHGKGLSYALYTAEGTSTCSGLPGSAHQEVLDAQTFASWGVDYLKADGCGDASYYPTGYAALGAALQATGRNTTFSCSWPAYLGDDESIKPFAAMIADGCNLWRNYIDQGPNVGYMQGILEHFGNYSSYLSQWAGPGHWHDPDMLLVGNDAIPDDAARSQFALYGILAAPLILGTDMRRMKASHRDILLNADAIAINQDSAGRMGVRLGGAAAQNAPTQVWYRPLENGDVAVALYNAGPAASHPWHTACPTDEFNMTSGGYYSPRGEQPASWCPPPGAFSQENFDWYCCNSPDCAGYNFSSVTGSGCWFKDADGPFISSPGVQGYARPGFIRPTGPSQTISVAFQDIGLFPGTEIQVYDVWQRTIAAVTREASYNASVPWLGTAYFRLSTLSTS
jgi:alpha-galactosidase